MYDLAKVYFKPGGSTYDIGAGTGRDAITLKNLGYEVKAVEPVNNFYKECVNKLNPESVIQDALPKLEKLSNIKVDNIFCSTVLMHLPENELLSSLFRLVELLKDDGILLLSWRESTSSGDREGERLYSHYTGQQVSEILISYGCQIEYYRNEYSDPTRPHLSFYNLVVKKKSQPLVGLARIQSIIVRDRKVSTYKLALLRSLCELAQVETFAAKYRKDEVLIPMEKIAKLWVMYYWPFANSGIRQGTSPRGLAIDKMLNQFVREQIYLPKNFYIEDAAKYKGLLNKFSQTIVNMPMAHISDDSGEIFRFENNVGTNIFSGQLVMSDVLWRDFVLYGHWIEQGLLFEWAKQTADFNDRKQTVGFYLDKLIGKYQSKRDTSVINEVKKSLKTSLNPHIDHCVWSDKKLNESNRAIDHILPFSGNRIEHLWNLVPAHKTINSQKSDKIPSVPLIKNRMNHIRECWKVYSDLHFDRFSREIENGLNIKVNDIDSSVAEDALVERVTHQVNIRGMQKWDYLPAS